MSTKPETETREAVASSELLSAAALVSTRWLEGKLTKHEMGRLGRACVKAMQAGIPLDSSSPFLHPLTKADNAALCHPADNAGGAHGKDTNDKQP